MIISNLQASIDAHLANGGSDTDEVIVSIEGFYTDADMDAPLKIVSGEVGRLTLGAWPDSWDDIATESTE